MKMDIEKIIWHDGNLVSTNYAVGPKGKSSLNIIVELYKDQNASQRNKYLITCENVERFLQSLNAQELKQNSVAGNISNGYVKGKTLWLYFCDGILEIIADSYKISKC